MEWMFLPLKKYAQFSGRSRRKEFWMWTLFVVIAVIVLSVIDRALGLGGGGSAGPTAYGGQGMSYGYGAQFHGGVLTGVFALAVLIPNLAVAVRRLHDTNRTGWWLILPAAPYLVGLVIMIGGAASGNFGMAGIGSIFLLIGFICAIAVLVFYCLPGTKGPNNYGEDPLGQTSEQLADTFN